MNQRQRVAHQRALVREAIGQLRAAIEYFGAEDEPRPFGESGYAEFEAKVDEFERWVFDESGIA